MTLEGFKHYFLYYKCPLYTKEANKTNKKGETTLVWISVHLYLTVIDLNSTVTLYDGLLFASIFHQLFSLLIILPHYLLLSLDPSQYNESPRWLSSFLSLTPSTNPELSTLLYNILKKGKNLNFQFLLDNQNICLFSHWLTFINRQLLLRYCYTTQITNMYTCENVSLPLSRVWQLRQKI